MSGETKLSRLIKNMQPVVTEGEYVFCVVADTNALDMTRVLFYFREREGITVVVRKEYADALKLSCSYVSSWITLNIHSSLEAVGLTAAFSNALANEGISCNVIAAFYHDHIFVSKADEAKAMEALQRLSAKQ